jgi:anti-sigma regulatory factor (Ser/Thr protein kinase)
MMTPRASSFAAELVLVIQPGTSVAYVQAMVRAFARPHGSPRDEWSLAIAASEATTNIVKFAGRGTLTLRLLAGPPRHFLFVAEDDGPGLDDPEMALRDHVSENVDLTRAAPKRGRRGLGTGLGAIARALNGLRIERTVDGGTRLVGWRTPSG